MRTSYCVKDEASFLCVLQTFLGSDIMTNEGNAFTANAADTVDVTCNENPDILRDMNCTSAAYIKEHIARELLVTMQCLSDKCRAGLCIKQQTVL